MVSRENKYPTIINWEEYIVMYNNMYNTNFQSEQEMLSTLIKKFTASQIANQLGVSRIYIYRRLDGYNIKRSHKHGGANNIRTPKRDLCRTLSKEQINKMTIKKMHRVLGVSETTIRNYLREKNIKHLKGKN